MTLAELVNGPGLWARGWRLPTHVKLASRAETVIANGAECEPLLHKDAVIMEQEAEALVRGLLLAREAVGRRTPW